MLFPQEPQFSGSLADSIDKEVARLIGEAHRRATEILEERREVLDRLSKLLMAREVIEGVDLAAYVGGTTPIPEPEDYARNGSPEPTDQITGPAITASPNE